MTPIPIHWFAFPTNAILVLTLIFATYLISIIPKTNPIAGWLASNKALISALVLILIGSLFIGLTPQQHAGSVVPWWNRFFLSWYLTFSITFLFILLTTRTIHLFQQRQWKNGIGKMALHTGLIAIVVGSYYGAPDEQCYRMDLSNIAYSNRAFDTRTNTLQTLPFVLKIKQIDEQNYPSGKPKRITAHLSIQEADSERTIDIDAGHPLRHKSYALHLKQYQNQGEFSFCSILIVKNPWRGWIYVGIIILLLGYIMELKPKQHLTILGLGALVFLIFLAIKWLNPNVLHQELVPALQSIWHLPHVVLYMMSFFLLSISFILCLIWAINKKESILQYSDPLIQSGLFLFTIALMIGSIWAESAWGHFWTWDLKETWALITMLLYTLGIYYRKSEKKKDSISLIINILSFISLQMCWYGIKLLPAAGVSLHIY